MKYIRYFLLMIVVVGILCSCANVDAYDVDAYCERMLTPENVNVFDIFSKENCLDREAAQELWTFRDRDDNGSIRDLNREYPIKCLRKVQSRQDPSIWYYRAAYYCYMGEEYPYGEGHPYESLDYVLMVLKFIDLDKVNIEYCFNPAGYKEDFSSLKKGQTLNDVYEIHPEGSYYPLYTGTGKPLESKHCTLDGYYIIIEYENTMIGTYDPHELTIKSITIELL